MLGLYSGQSPVKSPANGILTPTIYILDEEGPPREALEILVRTAGCHAKSYSSAEEFLARPRTMEPGCLLLDVALPRIDGLKLQEVIADRRETPVIFMSRLRDVRVTVRAMKAGAVDYLVKPCADAAILDAIHCAIERSRRALAEHAALQVLRNRHASLTLREQQVLALVVTGLLNKQVAATLGISEITVKAHRGKAMRKMCARSLADLVMMAAQLRVNAPS